MEGALQVRGLVKDFTSVRAVDGLSFEVRPGEIFALLGPNGAGKTSVVRMLLGIIRKDAGEVTWRLDGTDSTAPDPSRLGYLPEDRGLYKDVPVHRTLTYFGSLRGLSRSAARAAATGWLDRLGLGDRAKDKIESLSKGNQQKVQFAAAVLHDPSFVILDEPFSGLDPVNQDRFLDYIRAMRDAGATVLLSAHQMQLVERLADRLLLMKSGKEVLSGPIDEVRRSAGAGQRLVLQVDGEPDLERTAGCPGVERVVPPENGRLLVVLDEEASLSDVLRELARHLVITSIHDERPTLHDIYVDAVREREEAAS